MAGGVRPRRRFRLDRDCSGATQQPRSEPVENVNRVFASAAVVAIIVFGVLLAILWYFLNRASASK